MFFDSPFPLLVPSDPHTHFLLQEGEQVLPRPLLPHHCALQVCGEGLWDRGRDRRVQDSPGQRAMGRGIPDSCPLCSLLPVHIPHAHSCLSPCCLQSTAHGLNLAYHVFLMARELRMLFTLF